MSGTATPIATCRSHMDGFWLSGSRAPSSTCVPAKDTCSSTSDRRRSCAPWPRARSAWRRVGVVTSASSASQAPAYRGVVDRCEECGCDYDPPKPLERSLRWVAVHTVHEVRHHLLDVRRQLE